MDVVLTIGDKVYNTDNVNYPTTKVVGLIALC